MNFKMITEKQVTEILADELPEMNAQLKNLSIPNNLYKTIECFASYTKQLISEGKLTTVKHCFNVATRMQKEGSTKVKNVIENVYMYSVGGYVCSFGAIVDLSLSRSIYLKDIFNSTLRKRYYQHACANQKHDKDHAFN